MNVTFQADFKKAQAALQHIHRKSVPRAAYRALKRSASSTKVAAVREMKDKMGLPSKKYFARNVVHKSTGTFDSPAWSVVSKGQPIPMIAYKARQLKAGVKAKPLGQPQMFKGAFIINVSNAGRGDHRGVFVRKWSATPGKRVPRNPIREIFGPSIPQTMIDAAVVSLMKKTATAVWSDRFKHELRREIEKAAAR